MPGSCDARRPGKESIAVLAVRELTPFNPPLAAEVRTMLDAVEQKVALRSDVGARPCLEVAVATVVGIVVTAVHVAILLLGDLRLAQTVVLESDPPQIDPILAVSFE
jgi:hypothetical protein